MKESDQDYLFEQFRVDRGCLGYIVADDRWPRSSTRNWRWSSPCSILSSSTV